MSKFKEFFKNLIKGADTSTGITKSSIAQEKLKEASEVPFTAQQSKEKAKEIIATESPPDEFFGPGAFTETQRKNRVGEFTDEALADSYFDNKLDDLMPFSEYKDLRLNQGKSLTNILEDQRIIEDITPSVTNRRQGKSQDMEDSAERSIQFVAEKTGLTFEEARLAIMQKMNQGYPLDDLKRTADNDMSSIKAYLDNNLDYGADDVIEFLEDIEEIAFSGAIDLASDTAKIIPKPTAISSELDTVRKQAPIIKSQLEQMGLDTSKVDFDIIANTTDANVLKIEAEKLKSLMDNMLGGSMSDLAKSGNLETALAAISDEVTADLGRVQNMLMKAKTPAEGDELIKLLYKVKEEGEKAFRTGVYNSPIQTRTLNADGGRIGFKDGSGKLPVTRRTVLQGLAASLAAAFIPFTSKVAPKVAPKVIPEMAAQGMPDWFPMLVNKIKTQGKQTNVATSGRRPENVYTLKVDGNEYTLTEDAVNGNIDVFTRGDDFQQVSFEYIPPTEMQRPDGKAFTEDAEFYASEFMKGGDDISDYENALGGVEDLRLGIKGIEDFATKGGKTSKEKLKEASDEFMRDTTKVDTDGFAKGGKVGYNNGGGVGTLFKRKAS